jgi:hypothetical protein
MTTSIQLNVQKLESEVCVLLGRYGDIWYEGFKSAQEYQENMNIGCITDISPDNILAMSEAAETEYLKKAASKNAEHPRQKALNKFALEQNIEGIQRVLDCRELNLSQGDIDTIKLMQEKLHKEQE